MDRDGKIPLYLPEKRRGGGSPPDGQIGAQFQPIRPAPARGGAGFIGIHTPLNQRHIHIMLLLSGSRAKRLIPLFLRIPYHSPKGPVKPFCPLPGSRLFLLKNFSFPRRHT